MNLPYTYVAGVISGVIFPGFAQMQDDPARLGRGYLLMTRLTSLIAGPTLVTIAVAAPHLVSSLYGPEWRGAVLPLQILCAAGYFRALYHLGGVVVQSVGRVYGEFWRQLIYAALVLLGAVIGSRYGVASVAAAVSAAIAYMYFATGMAALRATHTTWAAYFRAQAGALRVTTLAGSVAVASRLLVQMLNPADVTVACAVVAAAGIASLFGIVRELSSLAYDPLWPYVPHRYVTLLDWLHGRRGNRLILSASGVTSRTP